MAHDDRAASLSIKVGERALLLKCHATCSLQAILDSLGLRMSDISPPRERPKDQRIVATYPYVDAQGKLLYEVVRYSPKGFAQRRPDPAGGWQWGLGDVQRVLYRLPQVLAAQRRVFIVEGEKDVHTLEEKGFLATTNAGGAEKWLPAHTAALANKSVVILPDNDAPGRAHAALVAAALADVAKEVRIVELPGLGPKEDVTDWFAAGGTKDLLVEEVRDAVPISTLKSLAARVAALEAELTKLRDAAPF
jgi:putative DNA primase/helicase